MPAAGNACASVTNEVLYLSGTGRDDTVPWNFRVSDGRNSVIWTTIPVPSFWETKGMTFKAATDAWGHAPLALCKDVRERGAACPYPGK